ncbi:TatD family hydrolase [Desulfotruncus alcoholivorax]|uniref:TatD family hydrolase n=1 Tax=Desulfotruncus alcoholivorax TaxID=265477 RepID=UPI00041EA91F|nr:TatD family hydrolase [Desulfotruncus alcoholivorax]
MIIKGLVDSHTHAGMIPYDGFVAMAANGITKAVSCSIVISARHAESYFDHFRAISGFYRQVAASVGVDLYTAVGVHPVGIPEDWTRVIDKLPELLNEETVVGIGEVGMNNASPVEKEVFKAQLEVARDNNVPVIIHTPKENRQAIVGIMLDMAAGVGINPGLLVVDHAHLDIIGQIKEFGAIPGLTIRKQNLTPDVLVDNLELFKNGMLNSDYSNIMLNDPVGMIEAVKYMRQENVDENIINEMAGGRASKLYGIK